jgi:hypothetical protein
VHAGLVADGGHRVPDGVGALFMPAAWPITMTFSTNPETPIN